MKKVKFAHLIGIVLPIAILSFLTIFNSGSTHAAATPAALGCQTVLDSGSVTSYMGCSFTGVRDSAENSTRSFLTTHADTLNLDSGSVEALTLTEVKHGIASTHTRYQQVFKGYPVFGGHITVSQGPDGNIHTMHSSYASGLQAAGSAERSAIDAEAIAIQAANSRELRHASPTRLTWFPQKGQALLAWEIMVYSEVPLGDFLTVVDATTGDILFQENRIAFDSGSGQVYWPNPYQTQGSATGLADGGDADSAALTAQRVGVTLERLDPGTGLLKGTWVDLSTLNSTSLPDVDADEPTRVYNYTRNDARFEQVSIYHTVDQINEWFHDLGFDDDTGTPNGIRDFPTLANAHWYDQDQSFYSTGDDAIHFGDGGVDDGEDADITAHEYGHAIQHNQNSNWGGGEMGAMGEGFGDFIAASFFVDEGNVAFQAANAPCVGEWDATSYDNGNPTCLRRIDGTKMYPDDLVNQVHADGEIWSRALWDIHQSVGRDATMQMVLEHHFALPGSATMPIAALALVQADVDLNGGANGTVIRTAFCDRGILVAPNCAPQAILSVSNISWSDAAGNNNGFVDPGEPIQLMVELTNSGTSTATNIAMTMMNTNGGAMMDTDMSAYPDIAPAGTMVNATTFALTVAADSCGNQIDLAFAGTYDDGVGTGIQMAANHTLQIGEFNGSTTSHPFAGSIAIPDNTPAGVSQSITVPITDTVGDLNLNVTANHTWVGDLIVTLEHVDTGTTVTAIDRVGVPASINGCSNSNVDVTLDDEATDPVEDACSATSPALGGSLTPANPLSAFDGEAASGDWTLTISDNVGQDTGTLTAFSIDITAGTYICQPVDTTAVSAIDAATADASQSLVTLSTLLVLVLTAGLGIAYKRSN